MFYVSPKLDISFKSMIKIKKQFMLYFNTFLGNFIKKYLNFRIVMFDFDSIFLKSTPNQPLYPLLQLFFFASSFIITITLIELLIGFMCDTFD